jgi:hypothetical protein
LNRRKWKGVRLNVFLFVHFPSVMPLKTHITQRIDLAKDLSMTREVFLKLKLYF